MVIIAQSMETTCFGNVSWLWPIPYYLNLLGLVSIPCSETLCPKYSNLVLKNLHLEGFNFSPASEIFLKTNLKQCKCSKGVLEKIMMSSK